MNKSSFLNKKADTPFKKTDTIMSKMAFFCYNWTLWCLFGVCMKLSLLTDLDVSRAFAAHLRQQREKVKWSRDELAHRSTVPASTIKKFELHGKISLRQLLLLWQCLDDLNRLFDVVDPKKVNKPRMPRTIEEVLKGGF